VRHEGVLVISPLRSLVVALSLSILGCSSAPAPTAAKPEAKTEAPKPESAKAETAAAPRPTPAPSDPAKKFYEGIAGGKLPTAGPLEDEADGTVKVEKMEVIVDPATGKKLRRVPKDPSLFEKNGRLFSSIVSDPEGIPIVRKDEKYFYLEALPERAREDAAAKAKREAEEEKSRMPAIHELPAEEAEVVTPKVSKARIHLTEMSGGLPKVGIWRDNFALADLDGDGRPEIVSPPPRLSGQKLRIFKFRGGAWTSADVRLENPENLHFGYGGVAVGDLDGDGRPDVVWGGHGGGLWVASNLGDFRFRLDSKNLPGRMSTRAVAVGDLDGDGRNDILAVSDMPEGLQTGGKPRSLSGGYVEGYDVRAFMNQDGRFAELVAGLDHPCFGYSLALEVSRPGGGRPFFISGCRYFGGLAVLYEFDRAKVEFENVGLQIVEAYSGHLGSGTGRYRGFPAAVVSYIKNSPGGARPDISGDGVSIYYRDGETWKRKRVFKRLGLDRSTSAGIAMGDLNGDGLDDVVFADDALKRVRIFFQTPGGEFEELDPALEPTFENAPSSLRIADVDGDGRPDIVLMLHYLTVHETRVGGFRFWRNLP
jgi:hypothetical protein